MTCIEQGNREKGFLFQFCGSVRSPSMKVLHELTPEGYREIMTERERMHRDNEIWEKKNICGTVSGPVWLEARAKWQ